jgi:hypothetical protein
MREIVPMKLANPELLDLPLPQELSFAGLTS